MTKYLYGRKFTVDIQITISSSLGMKDDVGQDDVWVSVLEDALGSLLVHLDLEHQG